MLIRVFLYIAISIAFAISAARAAEDAQGASGQAASGQAASGQAASGQAASGQVSSANNTECSFTSRISDLISGGADQALVKAAEPVICELLQQTRGDQFDIYKAARAIDRNIREIDCQQNKDCVSFVATVNTKNRELIASSYTDPLHQNANLSEQIQTRLPFLIEDSLKLDADVQRADFLAEFSLFTDRYLRSKRFRVGFGIAYSYLPSVMYQGSTRIDYSPFQSTITGGSDRLNFVSEFSNESFLSLDLSARIPYFQIDVTIPKFSDNRTITTGVAFRDLDDTDRDILTRSTVNSQLDIEYEISVKGSVFKFLGEKFENTEWLTAIQGDLGIGVGLTGFRVQDAISTDVRFRTDDTTAFNDLMPGETLAANQEISFNSPFWIVYYAFDISDEVRVGADVRWYADTNSSKGRVEVEDITVSIAATWYPTGFKKKKKQASQAKP